MLTRRSVVGVFAAGAMAFSALAFAPVASANYAPQLPQTQLNPEQNLRLSFTGAQPRCRATFSIRKPGGKNNVDKGLESRKRVRIDQAGTARTELKAPKRSGRYNLITRVDNFPRQSGCTPTTETQQIRVK